MSGEVRVRIFLDGASVFHDQLQQASTELRGMGGALEDAAAKTRQLEAAQQAATQAQRAKTRGMAEGVNMATEMALGFGGLNPKLREFSTALAMGGNNAVVMAQSMGPIGIAVGLITGVLPTLITQLVNSADASDDAAAGMRRHAQSTREAIDDLETFIDRQRRANNVMATNRALHERGTAEDNLATLGQTSAQRDFLLREREQMQAELRRREQEVINVQARPGFSLRQVGDAQRAVEAQRRAIESMDGAIRNAERVVQRFEDQSMATLGAEGADLQASLDQEEQEREEDRQARRRRGGGRRRRTESEEARRRREARELSQLGRDILGEQGPSLEQQMADERVRMEEEAARQIIEIRRELAEFSRGLDEEAKEAAERRHERELEMAEELKEKEREAQEQRLEQAREITARIGDGLSLVSSSFTDAFQSVIEGTKSAEEAWSQAGKTILKGLGDQMVQIGLRETLEGFANIVSAPPVAATKIPMGIALITAGVGLGAAGAAIPSAPAAAERPREEEDRDRGGGDMTIVMNYNQPFVAAGTTAQLARQMRRQMRDAEIPGRVGG